MKLKLEAMHICRVAMHLGLKVRYNLSHLTSFTFAGDGTGAGTAARALMPYGISDAVLSGQETRWCRRLLCGRRVEVGRSDNYVMFCAKWEGVPSS